ncbi:MAG: J domain-containing protein [Niabella sp.]
MAIDYYEILQISPSASQAEIKSAYRRLALLYHPDKNPDNKSSLAHFELIKEAYETLTHPISKEKYLHDRWLSKANGESFDNPVRTPENILHAVLDAGARIYRMDVYRMNSKGIKDELSHLLNSDTIKLLHEFNEISINDAIVNELLQILKMLQPGDALHLVYKLKLIKSNYEETLHATESELGNKIFWQTWKPAFIILIVVLLCILMWGTSLRN